MASSVVTFCSRMVGTSASTSAPVRQSRSPGTSWAIRATSGWWATKPSSASLAPTRSGSRSSARSAPGPHARAEMVPDRPVMWSVTGPSALRVARHTSAGPENRVVGSYRPWRVSPSVRWRSIGWGGVNEREGMRRSERAFVAGD